MIPVAITMSMSCRGGYLPLDMFAHTELFAELRETVPAVLMLEITLS